jgi:peptide/nickel transport system substrate-binding protein
VEKEVTKIVEKVVTATPEPTPEGPVTMRVGTTYIWDGPNPHIAWYGYSIRYLLYDALLDVGELVVYTPGLAESWSVSDDGRVWTFNIREGVTFHNGDPCTAEEIAWGINWMIDVGTDSLSYLFTQFEKVVALDPTTLQITLYEPVGNMDYLAFWTWITPESVWGGMTYEDVQEFNDISATIGTGMYKAVEWVEGEYLILEANENYWGGKPAIDRIIYQEYASEDAMVQAMLAGEIDFISYVPGPAVQTLQDTENVEVVIMEGYGLDNLAINSHEDGTQPASLGDPAVRLAIEYAIDREKIINVAYLGYGTPATSNIAPALGDWHNSDIERIPFDPDEGNRILDEAGYVDADGDGIREYSDGSPLAYRLMAEESATYARFLEIISDGLAQVGISAPPILMDYDSMFAQTTGVWDFDMVVWAWGMDIDPDFGMVVFLCDQRDAWGWSDSGYCNEEFEEMYRQQAVTVDHEERRGILWDMQEFIYDERPWIVIAYWPTIQAYRSDLFTGFRPEAGDLLAPYSMLTTKPVQ